MSSALINDRLLGQVLRGRRPRSLGQRELFTTGYWYVRLCQAVLHADERSGVLSPPFADLAPEVRQRAVLAVLDLPAEIGLLGLRELAPTIATLRGRHQLNILGAEALAAASVLDAKVFLSAPSPRLENALALEGLAVRVG